MGGAGEFVKTVMGEGQTRKKPPTVIQKAAFDRCWGERIRKMLWRP